MPSLLPAALTEDRCRKHGWWLLLVLTAMLYLPGLGTLPLMDRDEPRFAHAAVEMMQRDTWTVPYFNGEYRFDKPPLTYWWMRLHYHWGGINEGTARLHSVIATWLVAWVIFGMGKLLSGARAGLLGGAAWLLTLQVIVHGRLCVADMPMVLCVALALRAIIELGRVVPSFSSPYLEKTNALDFSAPLSQSSADGLKPETTLLQQCAGFTRWHGLLYIALGLGFLAKGPIAWLIPALALVLYRFVFWRQPFPWSSLHLGKGSLITLAIAAAWGIPALIETRGLFWKVGMGEHVIARGTTAFNGRFPVPGYYLVTALASLFPWIALLPQIIRAVRRQWQASTALLVSWLIAPYVIFTFYATQLAHYVMPGFPAAMVLLAVCGIDGDGPRWHRWWSGFVVGLFVALAITATWASDITALPEPLRPLLWHGALLLLLLACLAMFIVLRANKTERCHTAWIGLVLLLLPLPLSALMCDLRSVHPAVQLAQQVGASPEKTTLLAWQFTEPSLVFHFDREWKYTSSLDTATKHLARHSSTVTLLLHREWTLSKALRDPSPERDNSTQVDALIAAHPAHRVIRFSGFNAARSSWVELVVLVQP